MTISREDVLRVAELAQLELTPGETEVYRGQLDEILNYIGKLQQLDVTNVEPMTQMAFANVISTASSGASPREPDSDLRDDTLRPCNIADAVLEQAPDAAKPFFRVPKVIER
ncbi:MAG: Asp-tRNA(Asn)/Glu-tRNA(Gln) amidotransferase subunit GatC [Candidatus Acidiferrales bacterium]